MAAKIGLRRLAVSAGDHEILKSISLDVEANTIVSVIGPAHTGKSTLIRVINRLVETQPEFRRTGEVLLDGREVRSIDIDSVRRRVGHIFATPVPLPGTIYDNIAYGPRLTHRHGRHQLDS